ncbi:MAG: transposase [Bdellovibrionota bacterium]
MRADRTQQRLDARRFDSWTLNANRRIYTWKSKYGGMDVSEAQRLKSLEDENRRLKQLVADLSLDKEALRGIVRKNGWSLPV